MTKYRTNKSENSFSKNYTLYIKGFAIILMCMHHLFIDHPFIIHLTKSCVYIFTILSGYGLTQSFNSQNESATKFIYNHIKKIMINYWYVFITMLLVSFICYIIPGGPVSVYGTGIQGFIYFLLDFFRPSSFSIYTLLK